MRSCLIKITMCVYRSYRNYQRVFSIDPTTVAQPQEGQPAAGRDPRAKGARFSSCAGCRPYRARNDWEHTREIGECAYPYDAPWISECIACQKRAPRYAEGHTYEMDKCTWAKRVPRKYAPRSSRRPHEPLPPAHEEPTSGIPAVRDGQELGHEGEEQNKRS